MAWEEKEIKSTWETEMDEIAENNSGIYNPAQILRALELKKKSYQLLRNKLEWNNDKAGRAYRIGQLQNLIRVRCIIISKEDRKFKVRALVNVDRGTGNYKEIGEVLSEDEYRQSLLDQAMSELEAFRKKYEVLSELAPLFEAMDKQEVA